MNRISYERALVGLGMLRGVGEVSVRPTDIADDRCRQMWAYLNSEDSSDVVKMEAVFGKVPIEEALMATPQGASMVKVANKVREFGHRERVQKALIVAHAGIDRGLSVADVAEKLALVIDDAPAAGESMSLRDVLRDAYSAIEEAHTSKTNINFVTTGFQTFDQKVGGLQKNGLIVLAGRPSMGKSSFALTLARNTGMTKPVLFVSMEMSSRQLGMRLLASEGNVCLRDMMQGELKPEGWRSLARSTQALDDCNVRINPRASRTIADIGAEARRFKRRHGLGLLVIDYLTLLDMEGIESKNERVGQVTRALKILTAESELDCPIVVLSQLNRELEKRANKMPIMSDLRDSGAIEQDADQVIFLYREEVYKKTPENTGLADIIVAKNRNGPTGSIKMAWAGQSTAYKDLWED